MRNKTILIALGAILSVSAPCLAQEGAGGTTSAERPPSAASAPAATQQKMSLPCTVRAVGAGKMLSPIADKLQITDAQKSAWGEFVASYTAIVGGQCGKEDVSAGASLPDFITAVRRHDEEAARIKTQIEDAFLALYSRLDPEQQLILASVFRNGR